MNTNKYAQAGKLTALPGKGPQLAEILIKASELVSTAKGCHQYIVYQDSQDPDSIWVTEIWDSKEDHNNSLKLPGCMELISQAMPLLNGKPSSNTLLVLGGHRTS